MFSYFKARRLAKRYVELAILKQAIQTVKQITGYDAAVGKAIESLDKETNLNTKEVFDQVKAAGPQVLAKWRSMAKARIHSTKEAALLAPLEKIFLERFGMDLHKTMTRSIPQEMRERRIDGTMIRLFDILVDKI